MREFIYFSNDARTSGNFKDLMAAGRLDIACHMIIAAFFISNDFRDNIKLHLIFNGPPDPSKHLELIGSSRLKGIISKKDVGGLLKRMLFKYKRGIKNEAFPDCFIEKKSLQDVVENLIKEGKKIYIMDITGNSVRNEEIDENAVFIIGDHKGFPKKEKKYLKKIAKKICLGPKTYFASQSLIILQNELDLRDIN